MMSRTVIKLMSSCVAVLIIVFLVKNKYNIVLRKPFEKVVRQINQVDKEENAFYFVGSSRIQKSIDPEYIKEYLNTKHVYNLGLSASTFLSNCILVDYLLNTDHKKTIFIELSPRIAKIPKSVIHFANAAKVNIFEKINKLQENERLYQDVTFRMNVYNNYLFSMLSLREEVKYIINSDPNVNSKYIGYQAEEKKGMTTQDSFLKYGEFIDQKEMSKSSKIYQEYIAYILGISKKKGANIKFILPLTYRSQKEKDIIIPIYQSLPSNLKINYTEAFFSQMSNPDYLADNNHFNKHGAETYTKLLCPIINN